MVTMATSNRVVAMMEDGMVDMINTEDILCREEEAEAVEV